MPSSPYSDTSVPVEKSQEQIRKLLAGQGATATRFTYLFTGALVEFVITGKDRPPTPYRIQVDTRRIKAPQLRGPVATLADRRQRQVWRVLYWWLKAKFEAVDFGLVEREEELLPWMLVQGRDGQTTTVAAFVLPAMKEALLDPQNPFGGMRPALAPGEQDDAR